MRYEQISTPCYVVDKDKLTDNLKKLRLLEAQGGCRILLAQKAFSLYPLYPFMGEYLSGTAASGLYEARLGKEEMGKENHVFSAAYKEKDMPELTKLCDHIIFNSFSQLNRFKKQVLAAGKSIGIRINPECSTQEGHAIYDPCAPGSRLGVRAADGKEEDFEGVEGIHFHTLCEQNADDLKTTLDAVEERFGTRLYKMKWLNMGGGHHITREDYDIELLLSCIRHMKKTYGLEIYLEPGEAVALNAGYLVTEVLDITENGIKNGILDTSAACHMPDVQEMPYRPPLFHAGKANELPYLYRLGGPTCLAGDIIGDYSFDHELKTGERLVFGDMAIYTMVKNNTFNGMPLPAIYVKEGDNYTLLKKFGYEDFKMRLG